MRVQVGFRVQGSGFRVYSPGFRVQGFRGSGFSAIGAFVEAGDRYPGSRRYASLAEFSLRISYESAGLDLDSTGSLTILNSPSFTDGRQPSSIVLIDSRRVAVR